MVLSHTGEVRLVVMEAGAFFYIVEGFPFYTKGLFSVEGGAPSYNEGTIYVYTHIYSYIQMPRTNEYIYIFMVYLS